MSLLRQSKGESAIPKKCFGGLNPQSESLGLRTQTMLECLELLAGDEISAPNESWTGDIFAAAPLTSRHPVDDVDEEFDEDLGDEEEIDDDIVDDEDDEDEDFDEEDEFDDEEDFDEELDDEIDDIDMDEEDEFDDDDDEFGDDEFDDDDEDLDAE